TLRFLSARSGYGLAESQAPSTSRAAIARLAFNRQHRDRVGVGELALQYRVFQLHFEPGGGPDAALGGEGAAEHRLAGLERIPRQEVLRAAHMIDGALLVEDPLALLHDPGAQRELRPMRLHLVVRPGLARHRLGAELLGERHADGFRLAIRVVRAQRDAQSAVLEQYEFDLSAGVASR